MWRAIVAVRHSGDEICPPEGEGLNLTLGKSNLQSNRPLGDNSRGRTLPERLRVRIDVTGIALVSLAGQWDVVAHRGHTT